MIWLIIFGVIIIAIVISVFFDLEGPAILAVGVFVIFGAIFVIGLFISTCNHANDLESVEYHTNQIEIQKERVARLEKTLSSFNYPDGALMNKDSPISSIVKQISDAELAISKAKEAVEETKKDIRARKRWAFGFATSLVE